MKISCTAIIQNEDGNILLGKRKDTKRFSFIGGGLEKNETPRECISREVFEEVGIKIPKESFHLLTNKIVDSKIKVYVFTVKISKNKTINVDNDPDKEFEYAEWHTPDNIVNELELHIPEHRNIALPFVLQLQEGNTLLDSLPTSNNKKTISDLFKKLENKKLSFWDKLGIQKEIIGLKSGDDIPQELDRSVG